jgi:hypothetical protein
MVGLPAYLLGKQGVRDAMFLPEIVILKNLLPYNLSSDNQ